MTTYEELKPDIKKAKAWLKNLFGENPPFDPEVSIDSNGTMLIDKGRSQFAMGELGIAIMPLEMSNRKILCRSFEEAVWLATLDAVKRHFINNYPT